MSDSFWHIAIQICKVLPSCLTLGRLSVTGEIAILGDFGNIGRFQGKHPVIKREQGDLSRPPLGYHPAEESALSFGVWFGVYEKWANQLCANISPCTLGNNCLLDKYILFRIAWSFGVRHKHTWCRVLHENGTVIIKLWSWRGTIFCPANKEIENADL